MAGKLLLSRKEARPRTFTRETGPVCYELELLDPRRWAETRRALLASGLTWVWRSAVRSAPAEGRGAGTRPPTVLTAERLAELGADVTWRDADGYGRFIALYALGHEAGGPVAEADLDAWAQDFAQREAGPLLAVILQVGDSVYDHAFVPHAPDPRVRRFLEEVGPPLADYPAVPYTKLYTASLEAQLGMR